MDSILQQGCRSAFELIVLDDGSTDSSREIIEAYAARDERVKLFCQENQGPLYARKQLLAYAAGKWCIFADADDYWKPDLLRCLEDVIERNKDCDMVCFGTLRIYKESEEKIDMPVDRETVFQGEEKKKLYQFSLKESNMLAVWNKAFRKEIACTDIYEQYREMKYGEDRIQVLQLWKAAQKIVYLPRHLYCYRAMEGSLTQIIEISRFRNMQKYAEALEAFLRQEEMDTEGNLRMIYSDLTEDLLDGIFKYNTSGLPNGQKKRGLEEIRTFDYYKMLEKAEKDLKSYQRIRFYLLQYRQDFWLLLLDRLLYLVKRFFVKRKVYGS